MAGKADIYLYVSGRGREALEFYKELFNGEILYQQLWRELPDVDKEGVENLPDWNPDAVLYASLKIGDSVLMLSDNIYGDNVYGNSVVINWSDSDAAEVDRIWQGFVDAGAKVNMPLEPTFFSEKFGQLEDHFGIYWQVMVG